MSDRVPLTQQCEITPFWDKRVSPAHMECGIDQESNMQTIQQWQMQDIRKLQKELLRNPILTWAGQCL